MPPRQLLVRALVRRRHDTSEAASQRFVPVNEFGLWQYALSNRHGLDVHEASVGVWLPNAEWERHAEVFRGAAAPLPVDRLDVSLFDEVLGICHLVRRFAHRDDLGALNQRLAQHLGPGSFTPEVCEGVYAGARDVADLRRLSRPLNTLADALADPMLQGLPERA